MGMDGIGRRLVGAAAAPFGRDFWSARAVAAVCGTVLTVGTGVAQVGIGDGYRASISSLETVVRTAETRIAAIDAAVFEFKLFESNAALVQVLTASGAILPELRDLIRQLGFNDRRHAFLAILAEVHPDPAEFKAEVAEYDRLTAGAVAWDKALADAMIAMERDVIIAAHQLQQELVRQKFDALAARDAESDALDRYATIGFTLTQAGVLLVLFANLIAERRSRPAAPPAEPASQSGGSPTGA
jgi:hypothetical protein